MEFKNSFDVEGSTAQVIDVFANTPLLASFLPGASVGERREDGSYPGQLVVSFGPKRLTFKGSLVNEAQPHDLAGRLSGQASADVRGAKMAVSLDYRLSATRTGTRVDITSEAELTGILADFARTGGTVVTQALLEEFSQRLSAHMRASKPAVADGASIDAVPTISTLAPVAAAKPLSGFDLLLRILKSMFRRKRRGA